MRFGRRATWGFLCAVAAGVGDAAAAPPDDGLEASVQSLLSAIESKDARRRRVVLAALDRDRRPAVRVLMERLRALPPKDPGFDVVVEALAAVDAEQAIGDVESESSQWRALGWLAPAGETDDQGRRLDVRGRMLRTLSNDGAVPTRKESRLDAAVLADPVLVPPEFERVVEDFLPLEWTGTAIAARVDGDRLVVDADGDGAFSASVAAAKPSVVEVGGKSARRRVLLHRRLGRWYAAPTSLARGKLGALPVEFLDTDVDGSFGGEGDLVRFGADGAFRRVGDGPLAWSGAAFLRWRLRTGARGEVVEWREERLPSWATDVQRAAISAANGWRQAAGLLPQRLDRARSAACRAHHDYWVLNGFTGHDEAEGVPGFTREGAEAGRNGSVIQECAGGGAFVEWIGSTVLHRSSLVGRADEGAGCFGGGAGHVFWGGPRKPDPRRGATLVPAPGQSGVPVGAQPERPPPASDPAFYTTPRGHPVSVTWAGLPRFAGARDVRIELFSGDAAAPVPAVTFSPESPCVPGTRYFDTDGAILVPEAPLAAGATYTVRLRCATEGRPVDVSWRFRTGR